MSSDDDSDNFELIPTKSANSSRNRNNVKSAASRKNASRVVVLKKPRIPDSDSEEEDDNSMDLEIENDEELMVPPKARRATTESFDGESETSAGDESDDEDEEDDDDEDVLLEDTMIAGSSKASSVDSDQKIVEKILSHRPSATEKGTDEFLVKYKDKSYLHVEWISAGTFLQSDKNAVGKIKRFLSKPLSTYHYSDSDIFNPSFILIDRVIEKFVEDDGYEWYLIKWCAQPYDCATWEAREDLELFKDFELNIEALEKRNVYEEIKPLPNRPFKKLDENTTFKNGNQLRDYQIEGVNWLLHCWCREQGSIIADEMGLGKTVQTVTFLNQLFTFYRIRGPFLIIAPLSTVAHWERECTRWTNMNTVVFHGSAAARDLIVKHEFYFDNDGLRKKKIYKFNVLITTYEMAIAGASVLRFIPWKAAVLDEAHRMKNKSSKIAEVLKGYSFDHRVLATGTPLQNKMDELWALLNFLEPEMFPNEREFLKLYGDLKKSEDVTKLQSLLKPLMLRRLKEDVEKTIPVKEETIVEVELTGPQKKYYRAILERNFQFLSKGCKSSNMPNLINTVMELRKCCIHPYLINGAEDRIIDEAKAITMEEQFNLLIQASGKLVLLDKLLRKLKENGHRVLVFSQMTRCLDILADYLQGRGYRYERIDGAIRGEMRQAAIDRFCDPNSDSFVFLLCTRAGGVGINLTAADTVVIFDSDWNPQNDLQAQARCHRIGQTKSVKIYRLITNNTYEREMFDRASKKLGLDKAVLQKMPGLQDEDGRSAPQLSKKEVEQLLKKGAYGVMMENDEDSIRFCEEDIDQILARRSTVIVHDNSEQAGSIFSKASFTNAIMDEVDLEDPDFWEKWAAKANLDVDGMMNLFEDSSLIIDEPRSRKQRQVLNAGGSGPSTSNNSANSTHLTAGVISESDLEYSDLEDLRFEKKAPRYWSVAERQRLEKRLMTFGCRSFDQIQVGFPYRNRNDLIAASKQLVAFCLATLDSSTGGSNTTNAGTETDGSKFKADFIRVVGPMIQAINFEDSGNGGEEERSTTSTPSLMILESSEKLNATPDINEDDDEEYDEEGRVKKASPAAGQKPEIPEYFFIDRKRPLNAREPLLYPWASSRQIAEFRSFLSSQVKCPNEYREALKKRAKTLLTRMYTIHVIVNRMGYDNIPAGQNVSWKDLEPLPRILGAAPASWWTPEDDRAFAFGICKYGLLGYSEIREDPELGFLDRTYVEQHALDKGNALAGGVNDPDEEKEEMDVDELEVPKEDEAEDEHQQHQNGDGNEEAAVDRSKTATPASSLLLWPPRSELSLRVRRIFIALHRKYQTELRRERAALLKQQQAAIDDNENSSENNNNNNNSNSNHQHNNTSASNTPTPNAMKKSRTIPATRWSKRDRIDFIRIISTFGIPSPSWSVAELEETSTSNDYRDWSMFRQLATISGTNLARKSNEILDTYLRQVFMPVVISAASGGVKAAAEGTNVESNVEADLNQEHEQDDLLDDMEGINNASHASSSGSGHRKKTQIEFLSAEMSEERARRLLRRIKVLSYVRDNFIADKSADPEKVNQVVAALKDSLGSARRIGGLPTWWNSQIHDISLLRGVAKYGFGHCDLMIRDEELSFWEYYVKRMEELKRNNNGDGDGKDNNEEEEEDDLIRLDLFEWPKDAFIIKRVEYICEFAYSKGKLLLLPPIPWKKDKDEPHANSEHHNHNAEEEEEPAAAVVEKGGRKRRGGAGSAGKRGRKKTKSIPEGSILIIQENASSNVEANITTTTNTTTTTSTNSPPPTMMLIEKEDNDNLRRMPLAKLPSPSNNININSSSTAGNVEFDSGSETEPADELEDDETTSHALLNLGNNNSNGFHNSNNNSSNNNNGILIDEPSYFPMSE